MSDKASSASHPDCNHCRTADQIAKILIAKEAELREQAEKECDRLQRERREMPDTVEGALADILAAWKETGAEGDPHRSVPALRVVVNAIIDERDELRATFDLLWKADRRAVEKWIAEKPVERDLHWPDHTDLVVWLAEREEKLRNGIMKALTIDGPCVCTACEELRGVLKETA